MARNVAILLFDDVEVLDFAGPFEVFSVTNELHDYTLLHVYTVALDERPVRGRNGLSVNAHFPLEDAPAPDILVIPGGCGTRPLLHHEKVISWIKECARGAEKVLSVCTGALLLGQAGLLDGLRSTTHHGAFEELARVAPATEVVRETRFVDNGKIVTAAGISAGIDMSLHVVGLLYGEDAAASTARYMEYRRL